MPGKDVTQHNRIRAAFSLGPRFSPSVKFEEQKAAGSDNISNERQEMLRNRRERNRVNAALSRQRRQAHFEKLQRERELLEAEVCRRAREQEELQRELDLQMKANLELQMLAQQRQVPSLEILQTQAFLNNNNSNNNTSTSLNNNNNSNNNNNNLIDLAKPVEIPCVVPVENLPVALRRIFIQGLPLILDDKCLREIAHTRFLVQAAACSDLSDEYRRLCQRIDLYSKVRRTGDRQFDTASIGKWLAVDESLARHLQPYMARLARDTCKIADGPYTGMPLQASLVANLQAGAINLHRGVWTCEAIASWLTYDLRHAILDFQRSRMAPMCLVTFTAPETPGPRIPMASDENILELVKFLLEELKENL